MHQYYIRGDDGKEYGPASLEELRDWVVEDRAGIGTMVRVDEEGTDWQSWEKVPELMALVEVIGNYRSKVSGLVPASIFVRLGGYCADILIMSVPMGFSLIYTLMQLNIDLDQFFRLLMKPGSMTDVQMAIRGIAIIIQVIYGGYFIARHGCTPGQRIFGLRVVHKNGHNVSTGQAWIRALAAILSDTAFMLGYAVALILPQGRTWHDVVARTYVVRIKS